MLSQEDTTLLTRVGPGTPMGDLIRQFWIPALLSTELSETDGPPVRLRLLGEDLIGFRDTSGNVGILGNHCPHRGASLFFGRNEEHGLRCVYHGWKYDVAGRCVDMPNEPPESNFKERIHQLAYPCQERGGVVWTYMGPRTTPPPLPDLEPNMLPERQTNVWAAMRECNWAQGLEGDIDTSHFNFLHEIIDPTFPLPLGSFEYYMERDKAPRYQFLETESGMLYGAYRPAEEDTYYWRMAQFVLPFYTMIPPGVLGRDLMTRAWVPLDDEHTMFWSFSNRAQSAGPAASALNPLPRFRPNDSGWLGRWRLIADQTNDYLIDRDVQRTQLFAGIRGVHLQDQAITESMGPIMDRTQEHLGAADTMVVRTRQKILSAAKDLHEHGTLPTIVDRPDMYGVRSGSIILPRAADWLEATAELRDSRTPLTASV